MKDFLHAKSFKILIAVIFILFGLMLYTASSGGSIVTNILGTISVPMQRVSTIITNNAAEAAEPVTQSKEQLLAENDALKKQVTELTNKLVNYNKYKLENAQLRKYLELKNENRDFKPVPAAVIERDPNAVNTFKIDKGSNSGIVKNDPVITDAGVVGFISSVNANYSTVTTILSPDTNISALVTTAGDPAKGEEARRDSGVVSTNVKLADKGLIKLGLLAADTKAKAGDIVTTSGLGGVYPSGLPVGKVLSVKNEQYDVSLYAELEPFVNVKTVRDVMVITDFEGQGEALDASTPAESGAK